MADDRKRDSGEPAVEFRWDPLVLASDETFSTTIRIQVSGWWPEGRPRQVAVSHYQRGQEPPAGDAVRIQKGQGTLPLTGLEPGHHYHVVIYIGERLPVQNMITVPELPKPKKPGQEALESEQIELERAKIARQLREATPAEGKRSLKIVKYFQQPFTTEVFVRRLGPDGKPETGEIKAWYFKKETGETLFVDPLVSTLQIPAMFSVPDFWEEIKEVTFFLPDYPEVEKIFGVPARTTEKETKPESSESRKAARIRLSQRFREAYVAARDKGAKKFT